MRRWTPISTYSYTIKSVPVAVYIVCYGSIILYRPNVEIGGLSLKLWMSGNPTYTFQIILDLHWNYWKWKNIILYLLWFLFFIQNESWQVLGETEISISFLNGSYIFVSLFGLRLSSCDFRVNIPVLIP